MSLRIPTLRYVDIEALERKARAEFTHTCGVRDGVCMACRLGGEETDRPPVTPNWLLLYIAAGRPIPHGWAGEAFRTLGDDSHYAAQVRGYLMARGLDSLHFLPAGEDP